MIPNIMLNLLCKGNKIPIREMEERNSSVQYRYSKTQKMENTLVIENSGELQLMRMHRIGDPSAPSNLKGKQCTVYIPGFTSSSFKPSTRIISWDHFNKNQIRIF